MSVQNWANTGDDFLASEFTTSVVTVGGCCYWRDREFWRRETGTRVSLVAGETYLIDLKGADGDWGTLADPVSQSTSTMLQDRVSAEPMIMNQALEKTATLSSDLRRAVLII